MPNDHHAKAAQDHDLASQAHRDAADHHRHGDTERAYEASTLAQTRSRKAHETSSMNNAATAQEAMRATPRKARETAGRH